ncbi:hypothetical protein KCV03_g244, partial [Aureobasidium melanogenum]
MLERRQLHDVLEMKPLPSQDEVGWIAAKPGTCASNSFRVLTYADTNKSRFLAPVLTLLRQEVQPVTLLSNNTSQVMFEAEADRH